MRAEDGSEHDAIELGDRVRAGFRFEVLKGPYQQNL